MNHYYVKCYHLSMFGLVTNPILHCSSIGPTCPSPSMPSPCHPPGPSPVLQWTPSHVRSWLTGLGLAKYSKQLCDQHRIDGPALLMLQEEDLRQPPLSLDILGDRSTLSAMTLTRHTKLLLQSSISLG